MKCPKCESENVQVVNKKKQRSVMNILGNILITVCTGGIWLIILFMRGRKEQTRFICMDCKKEFK